MRLNEREKFWLAVFVVVVMLSVAKYYDLSVQDYVIH